MAIVGKGLDAGTIEDSGEVEASGKRPQTQCRQMMLEVAGCMHRGFVSSCGCTVAYV